MERIKCVAIGAMELIKDPMIELDVFSSCEVYGKDFAEANAKKNIKPYMIRQKNYQM